MTLYRIEFRVRPTQKHPQYWEMQFGLLNLFLFDDAADVALSRARKIVDQLPYEIVGEGFVREETGVPENETEKKLLPTAVAALEWGYSTYLFAWRTGEAEPDWFNSDWLKQ